MKNFDFLSNISKENLNKIDFHIHTTWTDGQNTSLEMLEKAENIGLKAILFSEHVRKSSEDWFFKFVEEIHQLPQGDCEALVGIETKIDDFDGNIDCTMNIIKKCDHVIASVHRFPGTNGIKDSNYEKLSFEEFLDIEYRLSKAALRNPHIHILGHPFGMTNKRFDRTLPEDMLFSLMKECKEKGVAFEVNSKYCRNPWQLIDMCKIVGSSISLGSDAHLVEEVGNIIDVLQGDK